MLDKAKIVNDLRAHCPEFDPSKANSHCTTCVVCLAANDIIDLHELVGVKEKVIEGMNGEIKKAAAKIGALNEKIDKLRDRLDAYED